MRYFYISTLIPILLLSNDAYSNHSFQKTMIKQKAKKKQNKCDIYIEINGNEDWEKKKDELNTIIKKNNKCRVINIYKSIKNVHTRSGKNSDEEYRINIGSILKKHKNIKMHTTTIIENTNITDGYNSSKINIGNRLNSGYINNINITSDITIKNTTIGSENNKIFRKNHNLIMKERSLNFEK